MKFDELSDEAKETIKGMVSFCINHGYRMGMDEGINSDDSKKPFRQELESFANYDENST